MDKGWLGCLLGLVAGRVGALKGGEMPKYSIQDISVDVELFSRLNIPTTLLRGEVSRTDMLLQLLLSSALEPGKSLGIEPTNERASE